MTEREPRKLDPNFSPNSAGTQDAYIESMRELVTPKPSIELHGQFFLNATLGGFRTNEFTILCGATGVGKSTLMANWSSNLIQDCVPHFVMSIETGHTDFVKRTLSCFLGFDINKGKGISIETAKSINSRFGHYYRSNALHLGLYDNRVDHKRVLDEIHWHREHKGCKIAIVDNLNFLMEVKIESHQVIEMDRVVHDFIIFAKDVDVHIVMVMHPKKTVNGRVESEFDVKGSSTAVQEAQNVLLFNRAHPDRNLESTSRELKFAKLRRMGEETGKVLTYRSIGTRYEEVSCAWI